MIRGGTRTTTLHAYWDTAVVQELGTDAEAVADRLAGGITAADLAEWRKGGPRD